MGYMYMPEQTADTIDSEGFLHSGDVAEFDDNHRTDVVRPSGFMKITGKICPLLLSPDTTPLIMLCLSIYRPY